MDVHRVSSNISWGSLWNPALPLYHPGCVLCHFPRVWLFFTPLQWALSLSGRLPRRSHPHQCHSHSCSEDSSGCSCLQLQHGASDGQQPPPYPVQRPPRALVPCGLYPLEGGLLLVTHRKGNGTPPPRLVREAGFLPPAALSHALSFAQLPCYERLRHVGTSMW